MLTIVCGEDTIASRNYYNQIRQEYTRSNTEIKDILPSELKEINDWLGNNYNLFFSKTVFFTQNLESVIIRRRGKKPKVKGPATLEDIAQEVAKRTDILLVDWENKQGREIKLKDHAQVKEFKPSATVFKLLDSCSPGSLSAFVKLLRSLSPEQDESFLLIMLYRHIRSLILASNNVFAKNCPPWQKYKLISQAKQWKRENLIAFYEGLYRVELTTKTGTNPYGIIKTLEILACYYL